MTRTKLPSFANSANLIVEDDPKPPTVPRDVRALQLLQMEYRGEIELTHTQRRAAEACLPFETPKLGVVATTNMTSDDFAAMLDRAIQRSEVKLIEHAPASPAPIPPRGTERVGPTPDRRFRRG
jgi:hypothetical protein